jgi:aromatic ring-opening dioxygenase LigB subunit
MSLVFAATVPDSTLTSTDPTVGSALRDVAGELYCAKPDTVIFITQHDVVVPEVINVNIANPLKWKDAAGSDHLLRTDIECVALIKEHIHNHPAFEYAKKRILTVIAQTEPSIDAIAPLEVLLRHLPETKVVLISATPECSMDDHIQFGTLLRHVIVDSNKRIAVIVSGAVSSHGTNGMPSSEITAAKTVDSLVMNFLTQNHPDKIVQINQAIQTASHSTLLRPLAVLLGIIDGSRYTSTVLSFTQEGQASQLVAEFEVG